MYHTIAMDDTEKETLHALLATLIAQHRTLDDDITTIMASENPCLLTIQAMKKQKLHLKDRIAQVKVKLTPDIIA